MKFIFLGIFTLILVVVWIFYVVLSIHAKKFANFSNVINRNLKLVFVFLLFLSISGYLIIIFGNFSNIGSNFFGDKPSTVRLEKYDATINTNY